MRPFTRKQMSIAAALIVSAGMVATGATLTASSASRDDATSSKANATTLNGYTARELLNSGHIRDHNSLTFDTCAFTTVLTLRIKAPAKGYLMASGTVGAARLAGDPDIAELVARLKSGTKIVSTDVATQLTTDGTYDGHVTVDGLVPVKKGLRTVHLQLSECSDGQAFVDRRSVTALFVPFGSTKVVAAKPKASLNR